MEKKRNYNYNIYLVGFMGSGKSTLGDTLSRVYRLEVVDTDRVIEKAEGMSVFDIFSEKGRDYFVEKEVELMRKLGKRKGLIVSCGGEAPLVPENLEIMKKGKIVYVKTPIEQILRRVRRRHTRPLLENKSNAEIAEMFKDRADVYADIADIIVCTAGKSRERVAEEVIEQLY